MAVDYNFQRPVVSLCFYACQVGVDRTHRLPTRSIQWSCPIFIMRARFLETNNTLSVSQNAILPQWQIGHIRAPSKQQLGIFGDTRTPLFPVHDTYLLQRGALAHCRRSLYFFYSPLCVSLSCFFPSDARLIMDNSSHPLPWPGRPPPLNLALSSSRCCGARSSRPSPAPSEPASIIV